MATLLFDVPTNPPAATFKSKPKTNGQTGLLLGLLALAILPIAILLDGYTLSVLWRWFIVKQFALAPLSIPMALGISVLVRTVIQPAESAPDPNDSVGIRFSKLMGAMLFRPLFALTFAWVVTLFM